MHTNQKDVVTSVDMLLGRMCYFESAKGIGSGSGMRICGDEFSNRDRDVKVR